MPLALVAQLIRDSKLSFSLPHAFHELSLVGRAVRIPLGASPMSAVFVPLAFVDGSRWVFERAIALSHAVVVIAGVELACVG